MPITKIPTSLLKKFQCSQCNRYLSVAPICIQSNGQSICGRCINWTSPQSATTTRCKLYEDLAMLHLFPCSYQPQGCLEYVGFNNATEHESKCVHRTYRCPVNFHSSCNWVGSVSQICQHYKNQHPELLLKTANFKINLEEDYEMYNLVEVENVTLLLQMKCASQNKKFWFNAVCIGNVGDELLIKYKVKLCDEANGRIMELEDKHPLPITRMHMLPADSVEVDINGLLAVLLNPEFVQCQWNVTVSENLKTEPKEQQTKVMAKCPNCSLCMVPPIYRCALGHLTCIDCKGYNEECGTCRETNVEFRRAIDVENVAYSLQFCCRWNNCQKMFNCYKIREHEQQCVSRRYKCPECGQYIGLLHKIFKHFQDQHEHILFEVSSCDTLKFPVKTIVKYVLVHKEVFKVSILKDSSLATWNVNITYYGLPGLESLFKYEVTDRYNILYYPSKLCSNHYRVTQAIYSASNVRTQYCLTIKFNKQKATDIWLPLDRSPKRART